MIVNGYKIEPNADLIYADLSDANLRNANLRNANLSEADLMHTNFTHADLTGANLKHAIMECTNLNDCKGVVSFRAGEHNRLCFTYRYNNIQYYQLGCFNGTYDETIEAIMMKYGNNSSYEAIITAYKGAV